MAKTPRWGGLRPAPYNPNARDADGDGIVQEGTMWERPGGTQFVDRAGKIIAAAVAHTVEGAHIVDTDGNKIDYTPRGGGRPGVAGDAIPDVAPDKPVRGLPTLPELGHPTIGEINGTLDNPKPTEAERIRAEVAAAPPQVPDFDEADATRISFSKDDVDIQELDSGGHFGNMAFVSVDKGKTLNGQPLRTRVQRVLDKEDLPDEVFHVTTAKDAVDGDGMIKVATGGQGLGGASADNLSVSVTTDRDIAETLMGDMKAYFGWLRENHTHDETKEHLRRLAREDGWEYEPPGNEPGIRWLWTDYFGRRQHSSPKHQKDPLFLGVGEQDIDPEQIKMYTIQREDIPDDVFISDFDMGQELGLEEARVWGDIPTRDATDTIDVPEFTESPIREASIAAVPKPAEPPAGTVSVNTGQEWVPEPGLTPSEWYPDSPVHDLPGYREYEGSVPPADPGVRDLHNLERRRLFDERRLNEFRERRRRKALGTERTWDHPARVDNDSELGGIMQAWRSGFDESAAYRQLLEGRTPAPAFDNEPMRERADRLAAALDSAGPMGLEQWRIQLGGANEGEIIDFPAASTAIDRKQAEGFLDSVSVFDTALTRRGEAPKKTLYRFPPESRGVLHNDETDRPREGIVTGRYRVKSIEPGKIGNTDVDVADLEYVEAADIARLDADPVDTYRLLGHETSAQSVIPDDLTDFDGEVLMKDIVGDDAELWHVTTALDAVKADGFQEGGGGFGTGYDGGPSGVSVTYDRHAAESFEEQIKTAVYAANGGDDTSTILAPIFNATNDEVTARDLAEQMGLDVDEFEDEWDVDALARTFNGDSFELYSEASQAAFDIQTERMEFAEQYDDFDEPGPRGLGWTVMPVVSDREDLQGIDPKQVGILKVASAGEATAADSLTHELRFDIDDVEVAPDVPKTPDVPEVTAGPKVLTRGDIGQPLPFRSSTELGQIIDDSTSSSDELKALFDKRFTAQAEDAFEPLSDVQVGELADEVYQHTQASLAARDLPETFVVWRKNRGDERDGDVESFSLNRHSSTFSDRDGYVVSRDDVLVDTNAFYPTAFVGEEEVLIDWSKVAPFGRDLEAAEVGGNVRELRDYLDEKYPAVTSFVEPRLGADSEGNPMVALSQIVVDPESQNSGMGSAFMEDLVGWADARGMTVTVSPSDDFGGNRARLDEFYQRFGFVPNSGRDRDYAISETMYRIPDKKTT